MIAHLIKDFKEVAIFNIMYAAIRINKRFMTFEEINVEWTPHSDDFTITQFDAVARLFPTQLKIVRMSMFKLIQKLPLFLNLFLRGF